MTLKTSLKITTFVLLAITFISVLVLMFVSVNRRYFKTINTCAPFAMMGEISYGDKIFVVCDHTDGPIVREMK